MFCPRIAKKPSHSRKATVVFNSKLNIYECLDPVCRGRFTQEEVSNCNTETKSFFKTIFAYLFTKSSKTTKNTALVKRTKPSFKKSKRNCPVCGSKSKVKYGDDYPRYECEKGHIFT